ncbi:MAG: hypothetical protein U0324_43785 [Polyangiales bacterium]
MKTNHGLMAVAVAAAPVIAGCAPPEDDARTSRGAVQVETAGANGVRYAYRAYKTDPALALASYAAASAMTGGGACNGVMIGPNLYMTAARCGFAPAYVSWRFAESFGTANAFRLIMRHTSWPVPCVPLYQTFADVEYSDMQIQYCPDDPATGLAPGDVFGYLDLDGVVEVPSHAPVTSIFSSGTNPLGGATGTGGQYAQTSPYPAPAVPAWTPQYGTGSVFVRGCYPGHVAVFHGARGMLGVRNLPGEAGNVGSPMIDPTTRRITVGPLSVVDPPGETNFLCDEGPVPHELIPGKRFAKSIYQYFQWSAVRTGLSPSHINVAGIEGLTGRNGQPLGLLASRYSGPNLGRYIDYNLDGFLDLQADLESALGEAPRPWVHLGFESPRRNRLWTRAPAVAFADLSGTAIVGKTTTEYEHLLRHTRLNLTPGTNYRISVAVTTFQQGAPNALSVGLCNVVGEDCQYTGNAFIPTSVGARRVFTTRARALSGASTFSLDLDAHTSFTGTIDHVEVVREGPFAADFDTHDTRVTWTDGDTDAQAPVIPAGYAPGPTFPIDYPGIPGDPLTDHTTLSAQRVDWALYVENRASNPSGWVAQNRHPALVAGRTYQMCFSYRSDAPNPAAVSARVAVTSRTLTASAFALPPQAIALSPSWNVSCFTFTPPYADNAVRFGFAAPGPGEASHYLVDDVYLTDVTP